MIGKSLVRPRNPSRLNPMQGARSGRPASGPAARFSSLPDHDTALCVVRPSGNSWIAKPPCSARPGNPSHRPGSGPSAVGEYTVPPESRKPRIDRNREGCWRFYDAFVRDLLSIVCFSIALPGRCTNPSGFSDCPGQGVRWESFEPGPAAGGPHRRLGRRISGSCRLSGFPGRESGVLWKPEVATHPSRCSFRTEERQGGREDLADRLHIR
jgi:hypothetical protein